MIKPEPADPEALRSFAARLTGKIEQAMQADLDGILAGNDPLLIEVLQYALFGGGKRIRPLLSVLSARICGRDDTDLFLLATAFEYLHVATLIHDDVIDHAATRRGRESVVTRYGAAAAILAGDWLHARSMHLVCRLAGTQGLDIFCRATTAMVDGEFRQLRYVADVTVGEQEYFSVIDKKTARLIASTCEIGAVYAGGSSEELKALATYGSNIGTAFQVIDDLLDYLGDQQATGKQIGNDLIEGKITLPLLHTLATADGEDRNILLEILNGERDSPLAFATVCGLVEKWKGFHSARQTAEKYVEEAIHCLDIFQSRAGNSYAMLSGLAQYILLRNK